MKVQKPFGHRRSTRLKGYDYTQPGAYFVTLLSWNRECLFGHVIDEKIILSDYGQILVDEWVRSFAIRREIKLDEFMVMPNHFHAVVWIIEGDLVRATGRSPLPNPGRRDQEKVPTGLQPRSLGAFIAGYKSTCTSRINSLRGTPGQPVWQRNYYDHIIRNDLELDRIRLYISDNPHRWAEDEENPGREGNFR